MRLSFVAKILMLMVWLACMGWLIRYEAFPHRFEDTLGGYSALSRRLPELRDTWMKVMSEGQHVGYVNSTLEIEDEEGQERIVMSTTFHVAVRGIPGGNHIRVSNKVKLDGKQQLQSSLTSFQAAGHNGSLRIRSKNPPESFHLDARLGDVAFSRALRIPEGAILASPLLDPSLASLNPGREIKVRTVDPLSMGNQTRTVVIRSESRELTQIEGETRELEVTKLSIEMEGLTFHAWVDEYGRVLRQETPFGLTFVRSGPNEAIEIPENNFLNPMRLLSNFNLPTSIPSPEQP